MPFDLTRRAAAELLGTGGLVCAVVGSGIMAATLAGEAQAVALLCNTIPTGAVLVVLITALGPVSGAHLNPAVSLAFTLRRELTASEALVYVPAQIIGGVLGAVTAHLMFEEAALQLSVTERLGAGQWLGELVATFGLVGTILACVRFRPDAVAWCVGLYITSAYWFTSSTSFANPAVTIGRAFSDTYSGIRPVDAPLFILMQCAGAVLAFLVCRWLFEEPARASVAEAGAGSRT